MTELLPLSLPAKLAAPPEVDEGIPSVLDWAPIDNLRIDTAYQRPFDNKGWAVVQRIAANFRWARFGVLTVAPLGDGLFAVIDGQHRAHAAKRCGFDRVPVVMVPLSQAAQAGGAALESVARADAALAGQGGGA